MATPRNAYTLQLLEALERDADKAATVRASAAFQMLVHIAFQLWPDGDPDHEWSPDTLDAIARTFHDRKLSPQLIADGESK